MYHHILLKCIFSRLHILPAGCHHRLCQEPEVRDRICPLWATGHCQRDPIHVGLFGPTCEDRKAPRAQLQHRNLESFTSDSTHGRQEVAWGYTDKPGLTRSSWEPERPPNRLLLPPSSLCLPAQATLAMPEARPSSRADRHLPGHEALSACQAMWPAVRKGRRGCRPPAYF